MSAFPKNYPWWFFIDFIQYIVYRDVYLHCVYALVIGGLAQGAADSSEGSKCTSVNEALGWVGLKKFSKPYGRTMLARSEGLPMSHSRRENEDLLR